MGKYKLASIFFLLIFNSENLCAQYNYKHTKIYIIRHAEKDTGNNPVLTKAGRERAGDLLRYLQDKKINHIYTTDYRRNEMTADSLRIYRGIDTTHYAPKPTADALLNLLKKNNDIGKTVLFIAHSNTVPLLINNFGVKNFPLTDLPDNAYNDIFLIRFKKTRVILERKKYGQPSDHSLPDKKMN